MSSIDNFLKEVSKKNNPIFRNVACKTSYHLHSKDGLLRYSYVYFPDKNSSIVDIVYIIINNALSFKKINRSIAKNFILKGDRGIFEVFYFNKNLIIIDGNSGIFEVIKHKDYFKNIF